MTEKNKGGRPSHEPTPQLRSQVESMCGFGIPADDIARSIGIGPDTLRKHYREELDNGTTKANTAVAQSLYKKALGDGTSAVTAAIFWLKTRAGWKETVRIENASTLTDEQLDARIRAIASVIEIGASGTSRGSQAPEGSATAH